MKTASKMGPTLGKFRDHNSRPFREDWMIGYTYSPKDGMMMQQKLPLDW